jgi:hypothetical protein
VCWGDLRDLRDLGDLGDLGDSMLLDAPWYFLMRLDESHGWLWMGDGGFECWGLFILPCYHL